MKKISLAWLVSLLSLSGMVFAATPSPTSEVRESTDPDKAAAVERHAEELRAQQQQGGASGESASGTGAAGKPMHEKKRMHKSKHMHKKQSGSDTSGASSDTSGAASKGSSSGASENSSQSTGQGDTASPSK
jgi:hypothetical protein